jgi:hypothetical protein
MNDRGLCPSCTSSHVELRRHFLVGLAYCMQMAGLQQDSVCDLCISFDFIIHRYFHTIYRYAHHVPCILKTNRTPLPACGADAFRKWKEDVEWCWATTSSAQLPPPSLISLQAMSSFPDYYAILSIPRTATTEEIRTAYKKESLRYAATPLPQPR